MPAGLPEIMSRKRRRDPANIDTQLVEIYDDLANEDEDIRLKAASSLLFKASPENAPTKDQLLEILTRLIRGLCSARKAARLGFSVALTEFLVQTQGNPAENVSPQLDMQEVIETLKKQTAAVGDVSGNEVKNYDFGRLFGAEAIIKSTVLFRPTASIDFWSQILDTLLELAKNKSLLRKECGWVLYQAIDTVLDSEEYVQLLLDKVSQHGLAKTPEGVAVWLQAQSTSVSVRLPEGVWHKKDPLHRKEKIALAKILRGASATKPVEQADIDTVSHKGNLSSDLHFAWDVVVATLSRQPEFDVSKHKKNALRLTFQEFWNEAVDDGLFSTLSSDQRKFWGFILFQRLLLSAPLSMLSSIFSENLIRCLMNQLASPERLLHLAAQKAIKCVFTRVSRDPSATTTILNGLTRSSGGPINFDQITKTKTIARLLGNVQDDGLMDLLPFFRDTFAQASEQDGKAIESSKRLAADQLVSLTKNRLTSISAQATVPSKSSAFVTQVLILLAEHAYFVRKPRVSADAMVADSSSSKLSSEMFYSRISSCLNHILAVCAEPATFCYDLVAWIRSIKREDNGLTLVFDAEDIIGKTVEKAWMMVEKIHSKGMSAHGSRRQLLSAFDLLYSLTLLQVYSGEAEAVSILDELKSSYDGLLKHKDKSENVGSDSLVEILLSFASQPSGLLRRLSERVFSAHTAKVTSRGLQSMIKVLQTKETLAGQGEIFDHADEEHQESSDDTDLSDASNVSMAEAGPGCGLEDGGASSSADSSDGGPDEELAAFNTKLALALGTRPATDDLAAGSEESSDDDMNEEQMEALDAHLEEVFRERKKLRSKKTQNKDAKEAIVNFKCRVLDLLDIYVKQQHTSPLTLDLFVPLLGVINTTKSQLVSNKACDVIRNHSRLCKPNSVPPILDLDVTMEMLQDIHQRASMEGSKAYGAACSQASLVLVRALAAQDRETLRLVEAVYGETHQRFLLDPKSRVRPAFFTDWQNWSVSARIVYANPR